MTKLATLVAVLALAGCPMQKSGGSTMVGGPGGGGGGSNPTVSGDAMVTMPDLMGKNELQAVEAVRAAGFKHEAERSPIACNGPEQPVGTVDCQDPEPGKVVQAYTLVKINVKEGSRLTGFFLREHFDKLKGMPIEQAKAQAKKDGHRGEIRVKEEDRFIDGCKENTVCSASAENGSQSGMDSKDPLLLLTNKTLSIAPPPD